MRKHNKKFAQRVQRSRLEDGSVDRSNHSPSMSHALANNKGFHIAANVWLPWLLKRALKLIPTRSTV